MPHSRRYYFIINPISGGRSKSAAVESIMELMNEKQLEYSIGWWEKGATVKGLVEEGVSKGYNTMVAVGGDGTINQVAAQLVHTDLSLGIIPFGSGNGFARHLGIKGHIEDQLHILLSSQVKTIDTGYCNDLFFVNIAGIGFDAHISHLFAQSKGRGLVNYARLSIMEGRTYSEQSYHLCIDGEETEETAFLISIANGSQWGNEFYIAPDAELNDGRLRCCLLKKPPLMAIPGLIRRFLTGEIAESKYYKDVPFRSLTIKRKLPGPVHFDGEPLMLPEELQFRVDPAALKVVCG